MILKSIQDVSWYIKLCNHWFHDIIACAPSTETEHILMSPLNQTAGIHLHSAREFPGAQEMEAVLLQVYSATDLRVHDILFLPLFNTEE